MPNWLHLVVNLVYHFGLAVWIGGTVALGALVAPQLFRSLPRAQAGGIFGPVLRRFSRLRVLALVMTIAAAAAKYLVWERGGNVWIGLRWAALAFMAAVLVYELGFLEKAMERLRASVASAESEEDPARRAFGILHRRAELLMKMTFVAALLALLLS